MLYKKINVTFKGNLTMPFTPMRDAAIAPDEENHPPNFRSGDLFTLAPEEADIDSHGLQPDEAFRAITAVTPETDTNHFTLGR